MKILTLALASALAALAPVAASADTWSGTLTETVTSTNDPYISVGQVLTGNYSYLADSGPNGTFYGFGDYGTEGSLEGSFTVTENGALYVTDLADAVQSSAPELIVSNGMVVDYINGGSIGYGGVDAGTFGVPALQLQIYDPTSLPNAPVFNTDAALSFSNPVDVSVVHVPDESSVALLVAVGLAGLILSRARVRTGAINIRSGDQSVR